MTVRSLLLIAALAGLPAADVAAQPIPPPTFADPARREKLSAAFPEIERALLAWTERLHAPGAVMGVLIDGEVAWLETSGVADLEAKRPVTPGTIFRIASMTKSFTALAILRLRDEGKLSLDDAVARYVPELEKLEYPTLDSPRLTIRHLLTHSEGFPEDNPWGDQQLGATKETMSRWMREGIPFSTVPGTAYEYSNYGFAILGQIVERVSKQPYDQYMSANIFAPLGMGDTTFEASRVPAERRAQGYRWEDEKWKPEPPLPHGTFGAMGGLWTSARDLARYVAYQMSAWPPRDAPESGPVGRASLREMQQAWRWQRARAMRPAVDRPLEIYAAAYGYGLRISQTCRFPHVVGHGGGLPGYGSLMMWLPDYGVGLIGMANVTYAGWSDLFMDALAALGRTGGLEPRRVRPSEALLEAKDEVSRLIARWDTGRASRIAADNLFLDEAEDRRAARMRELNARHGACTPQDTIDAENALRGTWRMECERGYLRVTITLAPTQPPRVQYLNVHSVLPPGPAMKEAIEGARDRIAREAAAWGTCRVVEPIGGDGVKLTWLRFSCERGDLLGRFATDGQGPQLTSMTLEPAQGTTCVP